jgi:hypothetical protein
MQFLYRVMAELMDEQKKKTGAANCINLCILEADCRKDEMDNTRDNTSNRFAKGAVVAIVNPKKLQKSDKTCLKKSTDEGTIGSSKSNASHERGSAKRKPDEGHSHNKTRVTKGLKFTRLPPDKGQHFLSFKVMPGHTGWTPESSSSDGEECRKSK